MELETLKDLYIHELKDVHSAEKQLTKAQPKMARAASNEQLAKGVTFFSFANATLLSAFLELKKRTVTRGRLCFLQSIRSLSYYEIRVQSDCGRL
jgi:hypothetical protein